MPRSYQHIKDYEKEILELKAQGYTLREIGEKFGFTHKQVHNFITRYNANKRKAGFSLAHRKEVRTSVKYMVIYRHKNKYSISEMCRFFNVSRSGYYGYVSRMDIPAKDLTLAEKIRECQDKCGKTYGYRRVHKSEDNTQSNAEIQSFICCQKKEIPQLWGTSA